MDRLEATVAGIAQRSDSINQALAAYIAHARERDDETTGKLNALIALMDRHLAENHGDSS